MYQYSWILERNDKALLQYFFVQEREPPLLCLLDLPEHGSFWDTPGKLSDDELYGPGGPLCTEVGGHLCMPHPAYFAACTLSAMSKRDLSY